MVVFHVSSTRNRASIARHGLDWRLMRDERGIAGSIGPEGECVFLARDADEAEWFVRLSRGNHETVDVWEVTLSDDFDLEEPPSDLPYGHLDGFLYTTEPIPADRLRLVREAG